MATPDFDMKKFILSTPPWQVLLILLVGLYGLRYFLFDPLRRVPGPFLARFTRLWLLRQYAKGDYEKTNILLHRKFGPVVRITPTEYSIDNLEAAKLIYGFGSHFSKSGWYIPWGHPEGSNLFNELDNKKHASARRRVGNAYSMSSLISYEPHADECVAILSQRLSEFASSGSTVNMVHWFQCYAFDMIGKITFSKRFGYLDAGEDIADVIKSLESSAAFSSLFGVFPSLFRPFLKIIVKLGGSNDKKGPLFIDRYSREQIIERKSHGWTDSGPEDFITKFSKQREARPNSISEQDILLAAGANVAAGSDTTAISLSAILYNLCRHPDILDELRTEIDISAQSGFISDPITFQEAQQLPYLQAVIKESLRIHPATGFTMPRLVPKGGCMIAGYHFPEGTTVGINSWVAHRNQEVFGADADRFRPARWLQDTESIKEMETYFFTFGQGSRTCLGKHVSLLEISKAIPHLIRHFDFTMVDTESWTCVNRWFVKPTNLQCLVKKRE